MRLAAKGAIAPNSWKPKPGIEKPIITNALGAKHTHTTIK